MQLGIILFIGLLWFSQTSLLAEEGQIPYFGGIKYDYISPAKFEKKDISHERLHYHRGTAYLGSVVYYRPTDEEAVSIALGYENVYFCWKDNPSFHQCYFNTLNLSLSGCSNRLCDWLWKGNVTVHIDTDHFNERYLAWDLLMWGRYAYGANFGLNVGFYAITGMKIDRVYPILGIDWRCWNNLNLQIVFPVNISALWEFNECWDAGVAMIIF